MISELVTLHESTADDGTIQLNLLILRSWTTGHSFTIRHKNRRLKFVSSYFFSFHVFRTEAVDVSMISSFISIWYS